MNLCEYFPCAKRPLGKRKSPCKPARGGYFPGVRAWEGGMASGAVRGCAYESILEDLPLECPALFDAGVTFPGEFVLGFGQGTRRLDVYIGPCVLSKDMQLIPCPKERFMGEVRVSANFSYKGPCKYVEGKGVVPEGIH